MAQLTEARRVAALTPLSTLRPLLAAARPSFPASLLASFLALSGAVLPAAANDSVAELATGGLVLTETAEIAMAREDLRISADRIEVDYVFRNLTPRDIPATVAFPMPEIGGPPERATAIPATGANFLDFTVMQDGKPIAPQLEARAFAGGRDVTAQLGSAGVPVFSGGDTAQAALDRLDAATAADWAAQGIIAIEDWDDGSGMQPHRVAQWTTRSSWHWQTVFPGGAEVSVAHRYRPSVGASVGLNFIDYDRMRVGGPALDDYRHRYCMDDAFIAGVNKRLPTTPGGPLPSETRLAYVLGTGGNWAGGRIGEFTLTVDKGRPDALVSFCGSGVEKTGPTTFRMTARDFQPPALLEVLIVTPAATGD